MYFERRVRQAAHPRTSIWMLNGCHADVCVESPIIAAQGDLVAHHSCVSEVVGGLERPEKDKSSITGHEKHVLISVICHVMATRKREPMRTLHIHR